MGANKSTGQWLKQGKMSLSAALLYRASIWPPVWHLTVTGLFSVGRCYAVWCVVYCDLLGCLSSREWLMFWGMDAGVCCCGLLWRLSSREWLMLWGINVVFDLCPLLCFYCVIGVSLFP